MLRGIKGIIFDFDGVIAESVQIKTDAFAALYESYGTDIVRKVIEHHEANGGMSRFEKIKFYHEFFLKKNITKEEISDLTNRFSAMATDKVISAPYVPGALEYIKKCYKKYKLFISTGTPTEEMKQILTGRGISQYFCDVFGSPAKKIAHINNIISRYEMIPNELIFYGDSHTDLVAAEDANIEFVLISNQFNEKLTLKCKCRIINNFVILQ